MSKPHEIVRMGMALSELFRRFPDDAAAERQFEAWRWPDGPVCSHCDSRRVSVVGSRRPMPYRCKDCRRHFSVTSGTVMHGTQLGAQTWMVGLFLIVSNPKGRSSVQLAADLGITQKSAWHLGHRIRKALAEGSLPGFEGPVEVDETYIGGKARNMHAKQRRQRIPGPRSGKTPVVGVKDRASNRVSARPVESTTVRDLMGVISDTTQPGAAVYTDSNPNYEALTALGFRHASVLHHVGEYVRGPVSTNGVENYWSHLKRTLVGTYHYWSPEHLHRYVEEHSFRYNRRKRHVLTKMGEAAGTMDGRRLTYRQLTNGSRG